jgi:ketosteroid isomerase-like protein
MTVLDLIERWAEAERKEDPAAFDDLLADDFVGVGPLGFMLTKQQWIGRFQGGLHYTSFALTDAQIREYGGAAVAVATQTQEATWQGRDSSGRFRLTLVAVRPADRWLLAGVHLSPIAAPPQ